MSKVGYNSDASNFYGDIVRASEKQITDTERKNRESAAAYRAQHEEKTEEVYRSHEEDLNQTVEEMRDHYDERLGDAYAENRSERKKYQESAVYDRNGRLEEAQKEIKHLTKEFEKTENQLENKLKKQEEHSQKRIEFYTQNLADQNYKELEDSNRASSESREQMRQMMQDDIRQLKRQLATEPNIQNTKLLSPEVEDHFKNQVASEYQRTFETQSEANKGSLESLHAAYSERLRQMKNDSSTRESQAQNRHTVDDHMLRSEFMNNNLQIQQDKQNTILRKDSAHAKSSERQLKAHSNDLSELRRNSDEALDNVRRDASLALHTQKQQFDFESRTKDRAHLTQVNTLKRDFDKQLSDTKEQYQQQITELKQQQAQEMRKKESEYKRELDQQTLGVNERLSSLEASTKERERLIHENYQDQIERMKRTNALKKKS